VLVIGSLLMLFSSVVLRLLEPWPLKFVFDGVLSRRGTGFAPLDSLDSMSLLTLAALAVVVIYGLRALTDYARSVGFFVIGSRVTTEVRNDLYRHLQGLSLSFHSRSRSGDLITRVLNDVGTLREVTSFALLPLLFNSLILVAMTICMTLLHWKLALVALAMIPLFWLTTYRFSWRMRLAARRTRQQEGQVANSFAESITSIKTVQALSLERIFAQEFAERNEKSQLENIKAGRMSARLERAVDLLMALCTALVLWFGALLVLRREMSPGTLLVFLTYLRRTLHPLEDFAKYWGRLSKAAAGAERVLDILDRTPEVRDLPGAVPAPPFRGAIRFEGVSFAYEPGYRQVHTHQLDLAALRSRRGPGADRRSRRARVHTGLAAHANQRRAARESAVRRHRPREYRLRRARGHV
jgi:ATP-binding cassette subfamily B protein